MKQLTNFQIFKVYFSIAPFILAEAFFIGSFVVSIYTFPKIDSLYMFIFTLIAGYFIRKKVIKTKTAIEVIKLGYYTNARLTILGETNLKHNDRKVKTYSFCFFHKGKAYFYDLNSAYHRNLKKGHTHIIFYHPDDPDLSFIPKLHSIDPRPFLKASN